MAVGIPRHHEKTRSPVSTERVVPKDFKISEDFSPYVKIKHDLDRHSEARPK